MTPENPAFIELAENVAEIKRALCGDPLSGKQGIIAHHNRMMEDVYGLDQNGVEMDSKKNTLLLRVSSLEDGRKKFYWTFSGVLAVLVGLKVGVGTLIEKYWK